tara:strand:+ start:569 stop:1204 length:636 start_codon:yes stop_codon:yes gene_type:complete
MALSKLAANSFDLTDNYAFTGTTTGATSTQKIFLIKNIDASSDSNISFVNGSNSVVLDNTYKTYLFKFINIHPSNDSQIFEFNGTTDGTNFNVTKTTTVFAANHDEADSEAAITYMGSYDNAQSTNFQDIQREVGNGNDECFVAEMFLFNPSSTTFVKHFMARANTYRANNQSEEFNVAGYFNTTSAITGIKFQFEGGTIDSGRIALYGIK